MRAAFGGLVCVAMAWAGCGGSATVPQEPEVNSNAYAAGGARCEREHPGDGPVRVGEGRQGSAVALARAGEHLIAYVADEDGSQLQRFDVTDGRSLTPTKLKGSPAQVMVLADGRVAVTIRDKNRVQILEPAAQLESPMEALCSFKTPVEPFGLAATPDDNTIVVSSAWAKKVSAYNAKTGRVKFVSDVYREPRAVIVDDDGERVFVSHVVGAKMSVVDLFNDHDVREIDLRVKAAQGTTTRGNLRSGCQGFALAKSVQPSNAPPHKWGKPGIAPPEGPTKTPLNVAPAPTPDIPAGRIFAPRVTIDPGDFNRQTANYYDTGRRVESPIVSVVDAGAERSMTKHLVDAPQSRRFGRVEGKCMLPRDAKMSARTGGLLVACAGTDVIVELDPRGLDPARLEKRRWKVPSGPMGLAIDERQNQAVVWSQFDRMLSVIDLGNKASSLAVDVLAAPKLAKSTLTADETWGRKIYHKTDDLRIARDGTACASCHPDGREDALTWPTPKGPRQTIALAGRLKGAAPFSWLGEHKDLHKYVKNTMSRLGGSGLPDHEVGGRISPVDALVKYLNAMPAPNLHDALVDRSKAKLATRGHELFYDDTTGCASCHVNGNGTDAMKHDLGTGARGDSVTQFDTPSLHLVAGTAPYFHDGRFGSLMEVLTTTDSQMGHTMHLSRADATALAAYLEQL